MTKKTIRTCRKYMKKTKHRVRRCTKKHTSKNRKIVGGDPFKFKNPFGNPFK
jgi:hypothetical protein